MKLNKIFGLLAVALCATAQIEARSNIRQAPRPGVTTRGGSAAGGLGATTSSTGMGSMTPATTVDPKTALVNQVFDNLAQAAALDPDVAAAVQTRAAALAGSSAGAYESTTLGRLGHDSNKEYKECCDKCAKKHKNKKHEHKKHDKHKKHEKHSKKEHEKKK